MNDRNFSIDTVQPGQVEVGDIVVTTRKVQHVSAWSEPIATAPPVERGTIGQVVNKVLCQDLVLVYLNGGRVVYLPAQDLIAVQVGREMLTDSEDFGNDLIAIIAAQQEVIRNQQRATSRDIDALQNQQKEIDALRVALDNAHAAEAHLSEQLEQLRSDALFQAPPRLATHGPGETITVELPDGIDLTPQGWVCIDVTGHPDTQELTLVWTRNGRH